MIEAQEINIDETYIHIGFQNGLVVSMPIAWSTRLTKATHEDRLNFKLIGNGAMIEWETLDEHVDIEEILKESLKQVA